MAPSPRSIADWVKGKEEEEEEPRKKDKGNYANSHLLTCRREADVISSLLFFRVIGVSRFRKVNSSAFLE